MPIRAVKELKGSSLRWHLPSAIEHSFTTLGDNTFEVVVQHHFDKNGSLIQTIGEQATLKCNSADYLRHFDLAHHPFVRRYGVLSGEYLEITFFNKLAEGNPDARDPIFPEREVAELDIPAESETGQAPDVG